MILVLSGTRDATEIIQLLKKEGLKVLATAVTEYGSALARKAGADQIIGGALDEKGMAGLIREKGVTAVVDATHPFAVEASKNAMQACEESGVAYLRYERGPANLPDDPLISFVDGFDEAAQKASKQGDVIFYTAGSKGLDVFLKEAGGKRIVVRVLPEENAIKRCLDLGIKPENMIAAKGPFSVEVNRAMMKEHGAEVLVTKESGSTGGVEAKVKAALTLKIPVVIIKRPKIEYRVTVDDYAGVVEWISKNS
jgi:precorrin-6A/cobalt-precorrin-6A reductase